MSIAGVKAKFKSESKDTSTAGVAAFKPLKLSQSTLPTSMDLASLMTWLTARMRKSDDAIRSKMNDMEGRKAAQKEISELINALRESKKPGHIGDGSIQLSAPLNDPEGIRNAEWFKNLDPALRDRVEVFLSSIVPGGLLVKSDEVSAKSGAVTTTWERNSVISEEDAQKHGLIEGDGLIRVGPRIHGKDLENNILALGDIAKDMSSSDEIEMIKLQSEVSARGQLLEMISNILAKSTRTVDGIISNYK